MSDRLDLDFQDAITRLRPGEMDTRVYDQGRIWVDQHTTVHTIADMSSDHLRNVQDHVTAHAVDQWLQYLVAHEELPPLDVLATGDRARIEQVARQWAEGTVLWRAIDVELAQRDTP